jgi:hypothetical protein
MEHGNFLLINLSSYCLFEPFSVYAFYVIVANITDHENTFLQVSSENCQATGSVHLSQLLGHSPRFKSIHLNFLFDIFIVPAVTVNVYFYVPVVDKILDSSDLC